MNQRVGEKHFRQLLVRMEEHWRQQGAPIAEAVHPGASKAALSTAERRLGLRFPAEVRLWFEWHDGTQGGGPIGAPTFYSYPFAFFTLDTAVKESLWARDMAASLQGAFEPGRVLWDASWLVLSKTPVGEMLVVECSQAGGTPAPVRIIEWSDERVTKVRFASLTDYVSRIVREMDEGRMRFDAASGWWEGTAHGASLDE